MDTKSIRKKYGWTQKQFAEKVNVSIRTVQNWDQGMCSPDRRSLEAIERLKSGSITREELKAKLDRSIEEQLE